MKFHCCFYSLFAAVYSLVDLRERDLSSLMSVSVGTRVLPADNTSTTEYKVKSYILSKQLYDRTSRPVREHNRTVFVNVGVSLYHILDTDEKSQTISTVFAIRLKWNDEFLTWNPNDFEGIKSVWFPSSKLWIPDIVINNNADRNYAGDFTTNCIVRYDGNILWMYPAMIKTSCTLNVRYFPFDFQFCKIVFISWTYAEDELNLTTNVNDSNANYYDEANQEWRVSAILAERHVKKYACCVESFPDITVVLCMERRSMFYIYNLIFPCVLMHFVALMSFWIPVESNDKIALLITVLLAMVVFLMVIGELMPPTPDTIPLIGILFSSVMILTTISLGVAILSSNFYHRKLLTRRPPPLLRRLFLDHWPWTPWNLVRNVARSRCFKQRQRATSPVLSALPTVHFCARSLSHGCLSGVATSLQEGSLTQLNDVTMVDNRDAALWQQQRDAAVDRSELAGCGASPARSCSSPATLDVRKLPNAAACHMRQRNARRHSMFRGATDSEMEWPLVAFRVDTAFLFVFVLLSIILYVFLFLQVPTDGPSQCYSGHEFNRIHEDEMLAP